MRNTSFIEGYTDQLSVRAGEEVRFHISTDTEKYSMEISRVGAQREVVWRKEGVPGSQYPVPEDAATHGCRWPEVLRLLIPEDWRSGYYSVSLRGLKRGQCTAQGEMCFIVRAAYAGRNAQILLQLTSNTDNAYNTWGGSSLYRGPNGPARRVSFDRPYRGFKGDTGLFLFSIGADWEGAFRPGTIPAVLRNKIRKQVQIDRITGISLSQRAMIDVECIGKQWTINDVFGAGPASYTVQREGKRLDFFDGSTGWGSGWHHWEQPFVAWAEHSGYQIDYAVNSDLEFHPEILLHYRLVLSVGHDEYWSSPMRDHLENFIAAGGNVVFFSGNVAYWQVRSEDNGRALVGWKEACKEDPVYKSGDHKLLTTMWCNRLVGRPENELTGVSFAYGGYHSFFDQFADGLGAYTVHRPEHWIFEGTGLKRGDLLGVKDRIVGYECDGCQFELREGIPVPTHQDGTPETFEILATAPAGLTAFDGSIDAVSKAVYGEESDKKLPQPGAAILGIYTRGGTVVTTGCTQWAYGLRGGDKVVERITRNILERLSA